YHDGMFYSVCYVWDNRPENKTGVDGVFLVSRAENVAGPWKMNAIRAKMYDPGLFFDDDGRVYVFHGQNDLKVTELDADLTKVVTPEKTIIRGTICEGTHAYKIDGKYYLFNPGGGKQHCFRSDSVYGPYEHKVVCDSQLTYEGSGLHQGGLVQLKNGDWWAIIFQDHGKLGRIPFLLPVEWKDGWPEVKPVLTYKKPAVDLESPITKFWREAVGNPDQQWRSDSFSTDKLGRQWQWNHHPAADGWSLTERPGWLRLKPRRTSSAIRETQNVLVQQIFGPGDSAQVTLDYSGLKDGDVAGLGLFSQHCTFVAAVRENGKTRLAVMRQMFKDGKYTTEELQSVDLDNLDPDNETNTTKKGQVVIRADIPFLQYAVEYSYSIDGGQYFRTFDQLAEPGLYFAKLGMPCEFFSDWLAIRYCLFYYSRKGIGGHADFDDFKTKRKPFDYSRTTETIFHAQLCDAYQNMSKPAFAWVTDPDAPPNLYLKWPNTSRIGSGIHDAASWAEAFEAKERRWLLFREVPFQASNGAGFTIRASGKGRIVLRACRGKVGGYVEIRNGYLSCTPGTSDLSGECEAPQALPSGSLPMKEIPLRRGLTGEFAGENGEEVEI
ncbi:MAG: family 43 glycosylhydrolase, partial [Lentisphaeria bacterium]|nr:family 43 glycosylhydrolase [Lentisphaeria bacterium]